MFRVSAFHQSGKKLMLSNREVKENTGFIPLGRILFQKLEIWGEISGNPLL